MNTQRNPVSSSNSTAPAPLKVLASVSSNHSPSHSPSSHSPSVNSEPPPVEPEDLSEPEIEPEIPVVEKPAATGRRTYQELTTAEAAKRLGYESDRGFRKAALKGMVCRNGWCAESVSEGQRGKSGLWKVWPEGSGRKKGKPTAKAPATSKPAAKTATKPGSNKAKKA